MELQERERGEPEITQVYDVKTKLKREGKGGRREKERDEISLVDAFFGDRFLRALLFSLLFSLTSFSSGHAAHNPLLSPVELLLFQHTARTMAKRRQKCLRRCTHNGTGQNNSTDVFRRWSEAPELFLTSKRIVSTIKDQLDDVLWESSTRKILEEWRRGSNVLRTRSV